MARAPREGAALIDRRSEAMVFDLFGTLVPEFTKPRFYGTVEEMARRLGADPEIEHGVRAICETLGLARPDDATLADALEPRAAMYASTFRPRAGAVETLRELKDRGYPIALVSMCAPDTPALWQASPMAPFVDVTVFSSETGFRKPDPEIYLAATDALDVPPERCLYCGDGAYGELTGAEAVGMTAYLIRDADLPPEEALRPEAEEWRGPAVDDLRELLDLLPGR